MTGIRSVTSQPTTYLSSVNETKSKEAPEAQIEPSSAYYTKVNEDTKATYEKPKALSKEALQALKDQEAASKKHFLEQMAEGLATNQANTYKLSKRSKDLVVSIFGSLEEALPPMATTPEGAKKAIEKGGAYSIEEVSNRLMKMATAIAGDDPAKLETMKKSIQQGFKAAGMELETGKGLPEICFDTYKHVMGEFDKLLSKE